MKTESSIRHKLTEKFAPIYLEIENESHSHSVPVNSETHFRVVVVSALFEGLSRIDRQRLINDCLQIELKSGVHALSQRAFSPTEWEKNKDSFIMQSPPCHGGSKRETKSS
ncbi:MAG: BolA family protein [Pseudobdellovibrionaceae bacterium]